MLARVPLPGRPDALYHGGEFKHWQLSANPEVTLKEVDDSSAAVARLCARILDENKMEHVKLLNVGSSLQVAEYFVVASGRNPRHLKAVSNELLKKLRESGARRRGLEGYSEGKWVLMDFDDVVVHVMLEESRAFYDLENLWGESPVQEWVDGEWVEVPATASHHPAGGS